MSTNTDKCEDCGRQDVPKSALRYVVLSAGEQLSYRADAHIDGRGYLCTFCRSMRKANA
jgi:hypothetical protein